VRCICNAVCVGAHADVTICCLPGMAGAVSYRLVISCRLAIFPFDVIKSKLQTDDLHNRRYKGMLDCARQVICVQASSELQQNEHRQPVLRPSD
jgi:hypothetical protein